MAKTLKLGNVIKRMSENNSSDLKVIDDMIKSGYVFISKKEWKESKKTEKTTSSKKEKKVSKK